MFKHRRKRLSQNFLYNRKLLQQLVGQSSIGQNDIVLDIGAGKGILTTMLSETAKHVVAVEIDHKLILHLRRYFEKSPNVSIVEGDILQHSINSLVVEADLEDRPNKINERPSYKVFANIPFSIEGKIIRQLLDNQNPPVDSYLVVRRDLAERLSGKRRYNQFSIIHWPWFECDIIHYFKGSDFIPAVTVDCVLWRIKQRQQPQLPASQRLPFQLFVQQMFHHGQPLKRTLRAQVGLKVTMNICQVLKITASTKPSQLKPEQWTWLYKELKSII